METINSFMSSFKNPVATMLVILSITIGNWWVNARRLEQVESEIQKLQVQKLSSQESQTITQMLSDRDKQIFERLDRIENKLDRLDDTRYHHK